MPRLGSLFFSLHWCFVVRSVCLDAVQASDGLRDEGREDVVRQLHLDLRHEPLVGLPPLLLLLLILHFHNFAAYYFFYYLLLFLIVEDLPDLVLLGSRLGVVVGIQGMLDGASARVGPGEDVVLHLVQYSLQSLVDRMYVILHLHERVLPALLGPGHGLALLSVRPHEVHRLVDCVEDCLVMNVISLRDHIRQFLLVNFFIALLLYLLDGLLDHAFPFLFEGEVELHVQNAEQRGIELLVLEHVAVERALRAVELVLRLSLSDYVQLVQRLVVDRRQEGVEELRTTLPYLLKYVLNVRFHSLKRGVDAGNQLLAFLLLSGARRLLLLDVGLAGGSLGLVLPFPLALELLELIQFLLYLRLLQRDLLWYFFLLLRFFCGRYLLVVLLCLLFFGRLYLSL